MLYIYILYSHTADRYYVGYTSNIDARLRQHNEQDFSDTYTSRFRPWCIVALFRCSEDERVAIKLERFIKKQHSRKLLEKLVDPHFEPDGILAQLVRVPHMRD